MNNIDYYRYFKVKNGKSYFAIVNINVKEVYAKNCIIENYSGEGYSNHSISVGKNGAESWKTGLRKGLEFILSKQNCFYEININGLEGKPVTDTNPTIIGYTGILAFCEKTNINIDKDLINEIENFVFNSWENGNDDKIPNFDKLCYE